MFDGTSSISDIGAVYAADSAWSLVEFEDKND